MKRYQKTLTADQIRDMNILPDDVLGFEYLWKDELDHYFLLINNKRVCSFENGRERKKSYDKIRRMGFGLRRFPSRLTEEEEGLAQSGTFRQQF